MARRKNAAKPGERRSSWGWMQKFRVWEANRKVFVYPENYIEPQARDDGTQLEEPVGKS